MSDTAANADLQALKHELVTQRGLPGGSAFLLSASTVSALEAQADELALFVASRARHERQPDTLADVLGRAPAAKNQQQRALLASLHPRTAPARDEHGRYAPRGASFDGGRRGATVPPTPPTHDQWLSQALASRSHDAGRRF
jgi:hypothetical protein